MSIKYTNNPLFTITNSKHSKYVYNTISETNPKINIADLCKIIDIELSIDADKYIEFMWRRDDCPLDREDMYMSRATNSTIPISYTGKIELMGNIDNDIITYIIPKDNNRIITNIKFFCDIKKVQFIKFTYGTYSIKLSYSDIIFLQHILDFSTNDFPFFPFRDGLQMNKDNISVQIKYIDFFSYDLTEESPEIIVYTNKTHELINMHYLHYYIKEINLTNNCFDFSLLNSGR